jgi:Carboxypeptidase regulatory-like domain
VALILCIRELFFQSRLTHMKILFRTIAVLLLSVSAVWAQQTGISGRVTDSQGAVIAGASVEVKQVGAAAFTTKTNDAGTYLVPSLTAGDYVVTVTKHEPDRRCRGQ